MSDQPHDPNATEATGLYDKLTVGSTLGGYTLLEQLSSEGSSRSGGRRSPMRPLLIARFG